MLRNKKKKNEWEKVHKLQEIERIYKLLDYHFDLDKYVIKLENGYIGINLKTVIDDLNCEKCCHFTFECKGKGLTGDSVMKCMNEEKHKDCIVGIGWQEDWDYIDETENHI